MVKDRNNSEPSISEGRWVKKTLTDILGVFSLVLKSGWLFAALFIGAFFRCLPSIDIKRQELYLSNNFFLLCGCSLLISENSFKFYQLLLKILKTLLW